jgi:hypothetical protein
VSAAPPPPTGHPQQGLGSSVSGSLCHGLVRKIGIIVSGETQARHCCLPTRDLFLTESHVCIEHEGPPHGLHSCRLTLQINDGL